ncbi:hypothetical protein KAX75_06840 [candidate division WOR-3 bacterium]|nr:hypothetical protein [candidate division WOR-3 bacterium]
MKEKDYEYFSNSIRKDVVIFRRKRMLSTFIYYLLILFSILIVLTVLFLLLDYIVYLGKINRTIIRCIFVFIPFVLALIFLKKGCRFWNTKTFVGFMEKKFPVFKGRLFAAFECSPNEPLFSVDLVNANLKDVKAVIDSLPSPPVMTEKHRKLGRVSYTCVILILFLFTLFPHIFIPTFSRIFFEKDILFPLFAIYPGNSYVEKGYDFDISLKSIRGRVWRPKIIIRGKKIFFERKKESFYNATIESVEKSFTYHIEFSDTFSREYTVEVVEHPRIKNIIFTLRYPSYTKEKDYRSSDFDLYALKGTKIGISAQSTQSLRKAQLQFDDSTTMDLEVDGVEFKGSFFIDTTKAFSINLLSNRNLRNAEKSLFHIFCFEDEYPTIEIVEPGENIDLPQELTVDVVINASDDYGISKVLLVWEKDEEEHHIPVSLHPKERSSTFEYRWDLMYLPMFPGDTLRYYAKVFDNDVISGPKSKRSKLYTIRFPTAEDIYREVASSGEKVQESFETESYRLEKLKEGLQKLEKSLFESRNLSWEEKKRAEEILKKEKELIENIEKTRKEMEDLVSKINQAFLSNPEIRDKLREIEKLMKELETEKIRKNIEELSKALSRMDRKEMLKSMEQMILSQEMIKKALERTIEMLKRIEQEARFERIVEMAEELEKEQRRINEEMEGKSGQDLKNMQSAEETLKEKLGDLAKEMEDLARELGRSDSLAKDALENATELASGLLPELEETQQAMNQGKQEQSLSLGKKAEKTLSEMSGVLSAGLSNMLSERRRDIEKKLNKIIGDIVFLSEETEKIMKDIPDEEIADKILARGDGIKEGIKKTLKAIDDLKSKNPFISQIIEEELALAARNIDVSANNLLKNNLSLAVHYAKSTMKSLNLAALELIESKKNLPAGGSGSMAQLLQQLQSLSSGQMQINQGTQMLIPIDLSGEGTPQEVQSELQRLSELQSSLAERLRRVEEGLEEGGGDILGDLGEIAREMEEVAKELGYYTVDRELIERQERILSRMLDAQRSVHKREFSKKREAERPEEVKGREPSPLPLNLGERKSLRKDILKELEERYPQEYRDLIRAYFNKLLEEERNQK